MTVSNRYVQIRSQLQYLFSSEGIMKNHVILNMYKTGIAIAYDASAIENDTFSKKKLMLYSG